MEVLSSLRLLLSRRESASSSSSSSSCSVSIDGLAFRLHYRLTVLILTAASVVAVAKQYFGDPINCQSSNGVTSKVLDDYCWIHSTFHVRSEFQGNVGCIVDLMLLHADKSAVYHAYSMEKKEQVVVVDVDDDYQGTPDTAFYQWVPFVLVAQAVLYYLPHHLWKAYEGGLMAWMSRECGTWASLASASTSANGKLVREEVEEERSKMDSDFELNIEDLCISKAGIFMAVINRNTAYFWQYFCCELLNLALDVCSVYALDVFLGGRFLRYGWRVLHFYSFPSHQRRHLPNPMCTVFPTITSCTFHSVGTAAGEQKFNSLCVLSLNIINEKIFLLLWIWLHFITVVAICNTAALAALTTLPCLRRLSLLLACRSVSSSKSQMVRTVLSRCHLSDWFILHQMSTNTNVYFFRRLLEHLEMRMTPSYRESVATCPSSSSSSSRTRRQQRRPGVENSKHNVRHQRVHGVQQRRQGEARAAEKNGDEYDSSNEDNVNQDVKIAMAYT